MQKIAVQLETVTPLFLGGADPRGEPELRPASFRGAMRYWLRAAAGSVAGDQDLKSLHQIETDLFGYAGDNKTKASAIFVRKIKEQLNPPIPFSKLIEHGKSGLSYLLFAEREVVTKKEKERKALQGQFTLMFSTRQSGEQGEAILRKTYAALWLLTHLGGIGNRARRGAGNLQVIAIEPPPKYHKTFPLNVQSATTTELADELSQGIKYARNAITHGLPTGNLSSPSNFDILHPGVCNIWVVEESFDGWDTALDKLGKIYKGFRNERAPDYKVIKDSRKTRELSEPIQRAAFGLPIPLKDGTTLETTHFGRRNSPLWFRIIKLATDPASFAIAIIWFKSKFLPDAEKLKLIAGGEAYYGDAPDERLVEMFIHQKDPINKSSLKDSNWKLKKVEL